MDRQITTGLLFLLYAAGSLLLGVLPHEHETGHHEVAPNAQCAVCVWQISIATDVPVVVAAPRHPVVIAEVPAPSFVPRLLWFAPSTLERAPPETLA